MASHLLRPSEEKHARVFFSSLGLLSMYNKDIENKLGLGPGQGTGLGKGSGSGQGPGQGMGTSRRHRSNRSTRGGVSSSEMDNDMDDRSVNSQSSTTGNPHHKTTNAKQKVSTRILFLYVFNPYLVTLTS